MGSEKRGTCLERRVCASVISVSGVIKRSAWSAVVFGLAHSLVIGIGHLCGRAFTGVMEFGRGFARLEIVPASARSHTQ